MRADPYIVEMIVKAVRLFHWVKFEEIVSQEAIIDKLELGYFDHEVAERCDLRSDIHSK